MLDFLFERNEQDEISNIYNYPMGRGTTQIIIILAVNCNYYTINSKKSNYKIFTKKIQYDRIQHNKI